MLRLPERKYACERMQLGSQGTGHSPSTRLLRLPPEHGRGKNSRTHSFQVVQVTFFSVSQEWRESQDVKGLGRKWLRLCTFSFSQTLQAKVPNRVP